MSRRGSYTHERKGLGLSLLFSRLPSLVSLLSHAPGGGGHTGESDNGAGGAPEKKQGVTMRSGACVARCRDETREKEGDGEGDGERERGQCHSDGESCSHMSRRFMTKSLLSLSLLPRRPNPPSRVCSERRTRERKRAKALATRLARLLAVRDAVFERVRRFFIVKSEVCILRRGH